MKHMMTPEAEKHLRTWQRNFIKDKFCPKHNTGDEHNLWFANCCTGSGKSKVGFESVIQNILFNDSRRKKSINVLVGPTIPLSKQIKEECEEYLHQFYPSLVGNVEFVLRNCESSDSRIDISKPVYWANNPKIRHYVFVYCADSFFGNATIGNRYDAIYNGLRKTTTDNKDIVCGTIVFDEAHNYKRYSEEITGFVAHGEYTIHETEDKKDETLHNIFMDVVCMTGTPAPFQCRMSHDPRWKKEFVVNVNYAMAIANGWIIKPDVYVVMSNGNTHLQDAVIAAMEHERELNALPISDLKIGNPFVHMLVNCPDILSANNCGTDMWDFYKGEVGVSILHSPKEFDDTSRGKNKTKKLTSSIDGKAVSSDDAKEAIKQIDKDESGKDRIVNQVEMISEGINVNSVNCCIITTHSDVGIIQQIGRSVRIFMGKNHTSIYVIAECQEDVARIVKALVDEGLDLDEVLKNIKEITPRHADPKNKDENAKFEASTWRRYTKVEIQNIKNIVEHADANEFIRQAIKTNSSALKILCGLICKKSPALGKVAAAVAATKGSGKGRGKGKNEKGTSDTSAKEKKERSSREMVNIVCREIENSIIKNDKWRDYYIPNLEMDKVIHFLLKQLAVDSTIEAPDKEVADMFRALVKQVNLDLLADEAEESE